MRHQNILFHNMQYSYEKSFKETRKVFYIKKGLQIFQF